MSVSPAERSPIEESSAGYGWARRTIYGGGGRAGSTWRALASPLGWAWRRASGLRLEAAAEDADRLPAPTVSVGNVTVGGGGKTSLVLWLLEEGLPAGAVAAVLSRGYGRTGAGPRVVAPGEDAPASEVGDEPALLARAGAWVGVGADRRAGAAAILARMRPDLFLLDDGLQHRRLARSLDLVTFTAADLAAPARCLPAGPLRQGPEWRPPVGAWVVAGCDPRLASWAPGTVGAAFAGWWTAMPGTEADWRDAGTVGLADWRAGGENPFDSGGRPVVAFAGVARPASVERSAACAGLSVERVVAFPDHHPYGPADIRRLLEAHPDAALVTTEKDAIKLDPAWAAGRPVGVLRRRLAPREPEVLRVAVREALAWPA